MLKYSRLHFFHPKKIEWLIGVFILLLMLAFSPSTRAAQYVQAWEKVPGAAEYQYQISTTNAFREDSLVKSGTTSDTQVKLSLAPGLYYFRLKSLSKQGEEGPWTMPIRAYVLEEALEFLKLKNEDRIPLIAQDLSFRLEWKNNSSIDLDDYNLRFESVGKNPLTIVTRKTSVDVPNLVPGEYKVLLQGRRKGLAILVAPLVKFKLEARIIFEPRILVPVDQEALAEFVPIDVRWIRRLPGKKTEIMITRADQKGFPVIYRQEYRDQDQVAIEGRAAGAYYLTVRDYHSDETNYTEQTIGLKVVPSEKAMPTDALRFSNRVLGGPFLGKQTFKSVLFDDQSAKAAIPVFPFFDFRSRWDYFRTWGLEGGFSIRRQNLKLTPEAGESFSGDVSNNLSDSFSNYTFRAGFLQKKNKLWRGDLYFKYSLELMRFAGVLRTLTTGATHFIQISTYKVWGPAFAVEWNRSFKATTDLELEAKIFLPTVSSPGPRPTTSSLQLGTAKGASFFKPDFLFNLVFRHKISREFRLLLALQSELGWVSVSEKAQSSLDRSTSAGKTVFTTLSLSPKLGFDWEI